MTVEQVRAYIAEHPSYASSLHKAPHRYAGTGADLVAEVAPYLTMTRAERVKATALSLVKRSSDAARKSPHMVVAMVKSAVEAAPEMAAKVREDVILFRESRRAKAEPRAMDAAAE